jgi:hypothetical protein
MTHDPKHQNEAHHQKRKLRPASLGYALLIPTVVIAGLNVFTSMKLYSSTVELRTIDARIAELAHFEKRISSKIDLMNTGLQNRLDSISDRPAENLDSDSRPTVAVDLPLPVRFSPQGIMSKFFDRQSTPDKASTFSVVGKTLLADVETTAVGATPDPAEFASISYERIVSANGKVVYKKVAR